MKKFRKIISVISAAVICTLPVSNILTSNAASAQGTRQRLVEIAEQELARGETSGQRYGTSGEWCAAFANWCLKQAGATTYSSSFSTTSLLIDYKNAGKYHAKRTTAWSYGGKSQPVVTKDKNYTPKVGDIVLIETNNNYSDGPDHTALVVKVESKTSGDNIDVKVYTIEGNNGGTVARDYWQNQVWGYCSPTYSGSGSSSVSSGTTVKKGSLETTKISMTNMSYPGQLKTGSTFDVTGNIKSKNSSPIAKIVSHIYRCDSSGNVQVDTCTRTPNTVTYNMSAMDEGIWFQTANQKGKTYKYVIEVTLKDGSKAKFEKSFKTV